MMYDLCGSPVSLDDPAALTEWNALIRSFLAHGRTAPDHLGAVLSLAPDCAIAHAAKGLFSLMLGRAELIAVARSAHGDARAALAHCGDLPRDRRWVAALGAWLDRSPSGAIAEMEAILRDDPADTFSAKVSHAIRFILGDCAGMRRSVERILPAHGDDHPLRGFAMGCHAFALEETGDYAAAERIGRAGLVHAPDDAWGLHAVAHVHDMTARPDCGIALIEANRAAWNHCNNFRYHVWWHKALLHLDRAEFETALALYDREIRHDKTDDYRDIANATSLLMRLELEGIDVGDRWDELAGFSEARVEDGCLVFADLHYALALAAAGRVSAQSDLALRYARDAGRGDELAARVADPGRAALAGLTAFGEGRYDAAYRHLAAARPAMQSIGGSHAQRDVFERMTVDAGLRAGRLDAVQSILEDRTAQRGGARDRFAATRFASIAHARRIPAQ